ncbi:MAG: YceI family protein [Bacteroidetes bacterium]|nr:YceI family protein [Bacteroidota bacterium]
MAKWIIDAQHSDVHFKTRYLVISSVTGEFKKFEGMVDAGDSKDLAGAKITFSADTDSVDTNNADRDAHLREPDFFDVAKFPKMYFESDGFRHLQGNEYSLTGQLTIKGVSRPIELNVIAGGMVTDTKDRERAAFEITGSLNRWDYGLMWSLLTEAGAIVLGEEVKIHVTVQLIKVS